MFFIETKKNCMISNEVSTKEKKICEILPWSEQICSLKHTHTSVTDVMMCWEVLGGFHSLKFYIVTWCIFCAPNGDFRKLLGSWYLVYQLLTFWFMLIHMSVETETTAITFFGLQDFFFNLDNFSDLIYSTAPIPTPTLSYSSTGEEEVLQREIKLCWGIFG